MTILRRADVANRSSFSEKNPANAAGFFYAAECDAIDAVVISRELNIIQANIACGIFLYLQEHGRRMGNEFAVTNYLSLCRAADRAG